MKETISGFLPTRAALATTPYEAAGTMWPHPLGDGQSTARDAGNWQSQAGRGSGMGRIAKTSVRLRQADRPKPHKFCHLRCRPDQRPAFSIPNSAAEGSPAPSAALSLYSSVWL